MKRIKSNMDVIEAARKRVKNVFANGLPVYMSFSGGKDSLCVANIVYSLIASGEISASQLTVIFIDEEAIFPCIEETVKAWRKKVFACRCEIQLVLSGGQTLQLLQSTVFG